MMAKIPRMTDAITIRGVSFDCMKALAILPEIPTKFQKIQTSLLFYNATVKGLFNALCNDSVAGFQTRNYLCSSRQRLFLS